MINQEVIRFVNSTKFDTVSKETFTLYISSNKEDNFAKTFISKCNMLGKWDDVVGYYINKELAGAILVTTSKKTPKTANLQLLHTFYKFRKLGIASKLCDYGLSLAIDNDCEYFRVSSEIEAVEFYKKIGIKFIGRQKSGCQLAMFRLNNNNFKEIDYTMDSHIYKQAIKKGKGSCVELFSSYEGIYSFV